MSASDTSHDLPDSIDQERDQLKRLRDEIARISIEKDALQRQLEDTARQLDERGLVPSRAVAYLKKRFICSGDMALMECTLAAFMANEPPFPVPVGVLSLCLMPTLLPAEDRAKAASKTEEGAREQQPRKRLKKKKTTTKRELATNT